MCFVSLIVLEDMKLKPPIQHLAGFVILLTAPKIKFHCTQFQSCSYITGIAELLAVGSCCYKTGMCPANKRK